jgi:hypothetical protein
VSRAACAAVFVSLRWGDNPANYFAKIQVFILFG